MTTEYEPGTEDIAVTVTPMGNGMVRVGIYNVNSGHKYLSFALPGENARNMAQKLTLASIQSEEGIGEG